jgi:F-type H+-transporting ATPase subunit b
MAIDAFTLIAQVVNFLVLLFLLRAFLFRPVQRVMAERERRIAEEHAAAERARSEAEAEARALRDERETLVARAASASPSSSASSSARAVERLDEVRAEADAARARGATTSSARSATRRTSCAAWRRPCSPTRCGAAGASWPTRTSRRGP